MAVSIREATLEDFDAVYQFICTLQDKTFDRQQMQKLYERNTRNPDNTYLIALEGGVPVGYLSCHAQDLLHHGGKVAEIQEMFVAPNFRSKGVGKLLMTEVKKYARQKGAIQLEVTTRVVREKAIRFYVRESFVDSHKKLIYDFNAP